MILDLLKKQQVAASLKEGIRYKKGKEIGRKRWKEEVSEEVLAHLVLRKEEEIESVEAFMNRRDEGREREEEEIDGDGREEGKGK